MTIPRILGVKQKLCLMKGLTETEEVVFEAVVDQIADVLSRTGIYDREMFAIIDDYISGMDSYIFAHVHSLSEDDVTAATTSVWELLYEGNKDIQDELYPEQVEEDTCDCTNTIPVTDYEETDVQPTKVEDMCGDAGSYRSNDNMVRIAEVLSKNTFDPTKPVQTRDGRAVRIVCTDARINTRHRHVLKSIVALVEPKYGNGVDEVYAYHADGNTTYLPTFEDNDDLINIPEEPEEVTKYVNVYSRQIGDRVSYFLSSIFVSRNEAWCYEKESPRQIGVNHIACIPITFTEGEGLE